MNARLHKAEKTCLILSYAKDGIEGSIYRDIIDELGSIEIVSTYGCRHKIPSEMLRPVIEKVKRFPLPDPRLTRISFENGDGLVPRDKLRESQIQSKGNN